MIIKATLLMSSFLLFALSVGLLSYGISVREAANDRFEKATGKRVHKYSLPGDATRQNLMSSRNGVEYALGWRIANLSIIPGSLSAVLLIAFALR
jgi:hypothetical protein